MQLGPKPTHPVTLYVCIPSPKATGVVNKIWASSSATTVDLRAYRCCLQAQEEHCKTSVGERLEEVKKRGDISNYVLYNIAVLRGKHTGIAVSNSMTPQWER